MSPEEVYRKGRLVKRIARPGVEKVMSPEEVYRKGRLVKGIARRPRLDTARRNMVIYHCNGKTPLSGTVT